MSTQVTLLRLGALVWLLALVAMRGLLAVTDAWLTEPAPPSVRSATVQTPLVRAVNVVWNGRPRCALRRVTGIACPACGGTRAFGWLALGDLRRATRANLLVVAGSAALLAWVTLSWISSERAARLLAAGARALGTTPGRSLVLAALGMQMLLHRL